MAEDPDTSRLGPDRLAKLWSIGSDVHNEAAEGALSSEERRADLLRDCLARSVPLDDRLTEMLPGMLGHLHRRIKPFSGDSIGALITSPDTDVQVLDRIKNFAKDAGTAAKHRAERDIALAVYYAAIASALALQRTRISRHSSTNLQRAFAELSRQRWVPSDLARLFEDAQQYAGYL